MPFVSYRFNMTTKWIILAILSFMLIIISGCERRPLGAEAVKIEPQLIQKLDKDLQKAFIEYWAARHRLDNIAMLYDMEAPHVRWYYSKEKFVLMKEKATKAVSVRLLDVISLNEKSKRLKLEVIFQDRSGSGKPEQSVLNDVWVKVDNRWWHVWKVPVLEKFI